MIDEGGDVGDTGTLCATDAECDDGLFCNGAERCLLADARADTRGCLGAEVPACIEGQTCDEDADLCQTDCDLNGDADGDGHDSIDCGGDDCDDSDASRYPGNVEFCEAAGHDEDCDPSTLGADGDADGDGHLRLECCNLQADGSLLCGDDCDDAQESVNPSALEVCDGDVDNDCNGLADAADGVCVPCPAGYRGFDAACVNIDECADGAPCGGATGASCTDLPGAYRCTCPSGYIGEATGGTCVDEDECLVGSTCGAGAVSCTNRPGSYACRCASGYTAPATGARCEDVDECAIWTTCGSARAGCDNTPGSYHCLCDSGYVAPSAGGACVDVNECADAGTCGSGSVGCTNTSGSYTCSCASGYRSSALGGTCVDVDECADSRTCGGGRAGCTNTDGSYQCICNAGYRAAPTGGTCVDVNECASVDTCGPGRDTCSNSVGGYSCTCLLGYTWSAAARTCLDNNECLVSPCGSGSCTNLPGSYRCTCDPGYSAPPTAGSCSDVDECVLGTDNCDAEPAAVCVNSAGSFSCACPSPFVGSGRGASGCVLPDPSLSSLSASTGVLSPAFAEGTLTYALTLPPGTQSTRFTPTVTFPGHATIRVNGVVVASGSASGLVTLPDLAPTPVVVTVLTDSGASRTYTVVVVRSSTYLKASNSDANDYFGVALALSADGSTLAVSAFLEASSAIGVGGNQADNSTSHAGAVYVFTRSGASWVQEAYVKASNTEALDGFGRSLALSADGLTLAVGASREDSAAVGIDGDQASNGAVDAGAVYVFVRSAGGWSQQAYVKASNSDAGDQFGWGVALSADGTTLAVGARGEDSAATAVGGDPSNDTAVDAGAAYVFTRSALGWAQEAYVKAFNTDAGDQFGWSVALSGDGSTLAVGAFDEASSATGVGGDEANNGAGGAGAVYVFGRAGATWTQRAYVKASNTDAADRFGASVALSGDGSVLAIGAIGEDSAATGIDGARADNSADGAGAVYVFTNTTGSWSQQAYIKASNTDAADSFGYSVALSADGSSLAVGASQEASAATGVAAAEASNSAPGAGAVYVFARAGALWSQQVYVKASNTNPGDTFGSAVGLSSDAATLAVGASGEASAADGVGADQTDNSATNAGSVYVL